MSTKEEVRNATLGKTHQFKTRAVEVEGVEIEVRELSIGRRDEMINSCLDDNQKVDMRKFRILSLVYCCFDGAGDQIYEDTDVDAMLAQPVSGFVTTLSDVAIEMNDMTTPDGEAAKNSEATQDGSGNSQ